MVGLNQYSHVQNTPAIEWLIPHKLNSSTVVVETFLLLNGVYEKALPANVIYVDANNVRITWAKPRMGMVRVI